MRRLPRPSYDGSGRHSCGQPRGVNLQSQDTADASQVMLVKPSMPKSSDVLDYQGAIWSNWFDPHAGMLVLDRT
jgi:hypothetical protein